MGSPKTKNNIKGPRRLTTDSGNFLCFLPNFPEDGINSISYINPITGEWLAANSEVNFCKPLNTIEWDHLMQKAKDTLYPMNAEEIETVKKAIATRAEIMADPEKFEAFKKEREENLLATKAKRNGTSKKEVQPDTDPEDLATETMVPEGYENKPSGFALGEVFKNLQGLQL